MRGCKYIIFITYKRHSKYIRFRKYFEYRNYIRYIRIELKIVIVSYSSKDSRVTHMQLSYSLLPPIQRRSERLGIHVLLQADISYPCRHHKSPTHLHFYCLFRFVGLSKAQFDYMICEEA